MRKIIDANNGWKYLTNEENYLTKNRVSGVSINVPSEMWMNGIDISHDNPYFLYKVFTWDKSFEGNDVIVKFNGVYSEVDVFWEKETGHFENGNIHLLSHSGGFTPFEINITDKFINKKCIIKLRIIDPRYDWSMASAYAKHPITGILRDVELLVLPKKRIKNVKLQAINFNNNYDSFELKVNSDWTGDKNLKMAISGHGFDKSFTITKPNEIFKLSGLKLWSDEIPNLYTVKITSATDSLEFKYGFRSIEVKKQNLHINGKRVMLRGINRHDLDVKGGRVGLRENDLMDVKLLKEANINYVRTSHYPCTKYFLDLCDEYGIYVESEMPVTMIGSGAFSSYYNDQSMMNNEMLLPKLLKQFDEMVDNGFNNSSIIIWSLCNESMWGTNFDKLSIHAKKLKDGRLTKFAFPGSIGNEKEVSKHVDVLSIHYVESNGAVDQYGLKIKDYAGEIMPTIHDEYAHIPSYNIPTLKEDPNVLTTWSKSLKNFMDNFYSRDGVMGGAVWCYQDEVFKTPDNLYDRKHWVWELSKTLTYLDDGFTGPIVGYGTWGIIDIYRQRKPQYFALQQAYSPIQFEKTTLLKNESIIKIINRYSFRNLSEFDITIKSKKFKEKLSIDVIPWKSTEVIIPEKFMNNDFEIIVSDKSNILRCQLFSYIKTAPVKKSGKAITDIKKLPLKLLGVNYIRRSDKDRSWCAFNREQIDPSFDTKISAENINLIAKNKSSKAVLDIVKSDGKNVLFINTKINVTDNRKNDKAHAFEIGLLFELSKDIISFSWERSDIFNYPKEDIGALNGKLLIDPYSINTKNRYIDEAIGEKIKSYTNSRVNYFMYGEEKFNKNNDLSNGVRSTKENVRTLTLEYENKKVEFEFFSTVHTRIFKDKGKMYLAINGYLDYPDISWGNISHKATPKEVKLDFTIKY